MCMSCLFSVRVGLGKGWVGQSQKCNMSFFVSQYVGSNKSCITSLAR